MRCFPGFVTLGHFLHIEDDTKKVAMGDKANHADDWENILQIAV